MIDIFVAGKAFRKVLADWHTMFLNEAFGFAFS